MDKMSITASRLKEALELRGMRQADLVRKTGIGKSAISQYLSGKVLPKQDKLYLLARALQVSEDWLLGRTGIPTNDVEGGEMMADKTDAEFNRIILENVLPEIGRAFSVLASRASGCSLAYNSGVDGLLELKAVKTKQIIVSYVDTQVEALLNIYRYS